MRGFRKITARSIGLHQFDITHAPHGESRDSVRCVQFSNIFRLDVTMEIIPKNCTFLFGRIRNSRPPYRICQQK